MFVLFHSGYGKSFIAFYLLKCGSSNDVEQFVDDLTYPIRLIAEQAMKSANQLGESISETQMLIHRHVCSLYFGGFSNFIYSFKYIKSLVQHLKQIILTN